MNKTKYVTFPDGSIYLGGINENGLPDGQHGTFIWSDGRRFIGSWHNGKKHGVGRFYDSDGNETYGFWFEDELLHEFKKCKENDMPVNNNRVTALLVGNNNYPDKPLRNCVNDAKAIGEKLKSIGIDVVVKQNLTMSEMVSEINRLEGKDNLYNHVFFFFSGHGITNHGRHYMQMIPAEGEKTLLSLEDIDELLCKTNFQNIILVSDACSNIAGGGRRHNAR